MVFSLGKSVENNKPDTALKATLVLAHMLQMIEQPDEHAGTRIIVVLPSNESPTGNVQYINPEKLTLPLLSGKRPLAPSDPLTKTLNNLSKNTEQATMSGKPAKRSRSDKRRMHHKSTG